ncbi:hypothetical protein [Streptomyces sp. NPDC048445]|uniref:hypothetical protein n=1 Tax=Streptomyces sp. NPDC048445 TaxID=3365553 RepID=UPI00371C9AAD
MIKSDDQITVPSVLNGVVAAVSQDSPAVVATVAAKVQRAQEDENSCMMGGWTA